MPDCDVQVLLVEDDDSDAAIFVRKLREAGGDVYCRVAPSAEHAMLLLRDEGWRPSVVVIDERLPGMSGSELSAAISMLPDVHDLLVFRYTNDLDLAQGAAPKVLSKPPMLGDMQLMLSAARCVHAIAGATAAILIGAPIR